MNKASRSGCRRQVSGQTLLQLDTSNSDVRTELEPRTRRFVETPRESSVHAAKPEHGADLFEPESLDGFEPESLDALVETGSLYERDSDTTVSVDESQYDEDESEDDDEDHEGGLQDRDFTPNFVYQDPENRAIDGVVDGWTIDKFSMALQLWRIHVQRTESRDGFNTRGKILGPVFDGKPLTVYNMKRIMERLTGDLEKGLYSADFADNLARLTTHPRL
jgi:hypothetical protein